MSKNDPTEFITIVPNGKDDTQNIQNTVNTANGKTIVLNGEYFVTEPIVGKSINILAKNAIIKSKNKGETFLAKGILRGTYIATGGYNKGANYILLNHTAGIKKGDIIRIVASKELYHPSRGYYWKGGNFEISNVEADRVWIHGAMPFDMKMIDIVEVHDPACVKIVGSLRIENTAPLPNGLFGIRIDFGKDIYIEGVTVDNYVTCITPRFCVNVHMKFVKTERAYYSGTGTSYGLATISSTNILYENCSTQSGRHGHSSGGWEPVYNLQFINCMIFNEPQAANSASMDTHDNLVNVIMQNCQMDSFQLAGNVTMLNCTVFHKARKHSGFVSQNAYDKANYIFDGIYFPNGGTVQLNGYSQSGGSWTMDKVGSVIARNWRSPVSMNIMFRAKQTNRSMPVQNIGSVLVENCRNLQVLVEDHIENVTVSNSVYSLDAVFIYQYGGHVNNIKIDSCTFTARYHAIHLIHFTSCLITNCSDLDIGNRAPRLVVACRKGILTMINNNLPHFTQGLAVHVNKYVLINTDIPFYGRPVGTAVLI
ncbi:hypothetical protein [Bacillus sp. V5-8f]|uniref:hypothetical protein n=1 Tax=Bacillus sp. V5-8f TaxID=2053044 RepID=UPI000C771D81|nr:hypothetical protein [Bacillus sp. V5-8f]PLT35621.1 hypothetical protein CUU64_03180 [Bacillus sp. V5-8f]